MPWASRRGLRGRQLGGGDRAGCPSQCTQPGASLSPSVFRVDTAASQPERGWLAGRVQFRQFGDRWPVHPPYPMKPELEVRRAW